MFRGKLNAAIRVGLVVGVTIVNGFNQQPLYAQSTGETPPTTTTPTPTNPALRTQIEETDKVRVTADFSLSNYCDQQVTSGRTADSSSDSFKSVRRLACTNGDIDLPGAAFNPSRLPGLYQVVAQQLYNEYGSYHGRYYLGSELDGNTGVVLPSKVPVCNLAANEKENNWLHGFVAGDARMRHYWSCGSTCTFVSGNHQMADGQSRKVYLPDLSMYKYNGVFRPAYMLTHSECQREFAWYRGIWVHYLWNRTHQVAQEVQRTGAIQMTIDESGTSPCGKFSDDLSASSGEIDAVERMIVDTLKGKNLGKITCDRGSVQMTTDDGGNIRTNDDNMRRLAEGAGIDAGRAEGQDMSNLAVCMLESARVMQTRAITSLAWCETLWRTHLDYDRYVNEPSVMNSAILALEHRVKNDYTNAAGVQVDTGRCRSDKAARRLECYGRELETWFNEFFYSRVVNPTRVPPPTGPIGAVDVNCIFDKDRPGCSTGGSR